MSHYPVLTMQTAPVEARQVLSELNQTFGFVPNVAGVMAASPPLIKSFLALFSGVHSGSFSEAEIQVLLLTNAVVNRSEWPVAFHTGLALLQGVDAADVAAIRHRQLPALPRFAALSALSRALIDKRGRLDAQDEADFSAGGFEPEQLLEAISVVAASTITNYVSNVARPSVEAAFIEHAWQAPE